MVRTIRSESVCRQGPTPPNSGGRAPAVAAPAAETQSAEATAAETPPAELPPTEMPPAEAHLPPRPSWLTHRMIACTAAVLVLAGAFAVWRWRAVNPTSVDAKSAPISNPSLTATSAVENLWMIAGSTAPYVDRSGRTWGPDRFFSGGNVLVRPSERIYRTLDPDIYRHLRSGDFRYDIPLQPGNYELHLFFAETGLADFISAESSGEGQRLFRVSANGNPILTAFDVVADAAGSNIADERVFRNISPAADGFLHLSFNSMRSTAMLSGIEVLPAQCRESKTGPNSSGLDLIVAGFRRAGVAVRLLFPGRKRVGPHYESRPGEQLNRTGYGALRERALGAFFLRCARGGGPVSSHVEIL